MTTERPIYSVGERVDGLYDENTDEMWYPGRIQCVHPGEDGVTFEILYDDGEVEVHVRPEFLRKHVPGTICVGTRVLCRYDGGDEYYPGQISDVQENGRYTIAYDDGEVEEDVTLGHIVEPRENEEEAETGEAADDVESDQVNQEGNGEEVEAQDHPTESDVNRAEVYSRDPINDLDDDANVPEEANEDENTGNDADNNAEGPMADQPTDNFFQPNATRPKQAYADADESPSSGNQPDSVIPRDPAENAYILESLELLEKRLGDATSTKSVLSTLVKQMRAYPQITADLVHERGGERLIIDALKFHQSHAVIQCYGCVLLRRLCFLCVKSTQYLLRNGIVELVLQAMKSFAEDAILQASACGALAVFTRVRTGLNILIEYQVAHLVLSTLIYHKTYSVHTRQVHYYACEVLLELCELDDLQTLNLLCGEQEEEFTSEMSPISLLLFLLRQGLSLDDKKACCAVGSLLMCLAASGRRAAALILSLNGLAELSTVMARYPTEPSIQKYSAAASKQIALCSVRQSPTKRIKETATEILREADSIECTPIERPIPKKNMSRGRSMKTGKRKNNSSTGYEAAQTYPRGAAYSASTPYRDSPGYSKLTSPYMQTSQDFAKDRSTFGYPVRDFPASAGALQQPSNLVILDGGLGMDNYGVENKRRGLPSKEDRHSELFDAYGIHPIPKTSNGRPYGTKRAQLRAHLASAEIAWDAPGQYLSRDEMLAGPSTRKPRSSNSNYHVEDPGYSNRGPMSSRQSRWGFGEDQNPNDPEFLQPRGPKRKKKTPLGQRTAFQVRIENENQLRVSKQQQAPYSPHHRLGAATKRAAKARHKRIAAGAHTPLSGRMNDASSESLNEYAAHLFQDSAGIGVHIPTTRLTPREKEEMRERERLSFAEKLHKMIDKAKSSLNGNVMPTSDAPRSKRSAAAATKPHRQLGATGKAPRSSESRVLSQPNKKIRETPTNPSKRVLTDLSSPQEAPETTAVKPSSVAPKPKVVFNDAGAQRAPSVHQPRIKASAARPAAAPKPTTEQKVQNAAKPSTVPIAAAEAKPVDISNQEEKKHAEEVTPVKPSADAMEDTPQQATSTEKTPMIPSDQSTEQLQVPSEIPSMSQADEAKQEILGKNEGNRLPVADTGPMSEAEASEPSSDHGVDLPHMEDAEEIQDEKAGEETMAAVTPSVEPETTTASELPLQVAEQDPDSTDAGAEVEGEKSDPAAALGPPAVPAVEEPTPTPDDTGSNAMVDVMYGDDYNEFEDNGGDDEDMASDTDVDIPTTATGPVTDGTLPVSKSGEDLYGNDDNEFEEDDIPNIEETEATGVPAVTGEEPAAPSSHIDTQDEESLAVMENDPVASGVDLDHEDKREPADSTSDNIGSSEVKENDSETAAFKSASDPVEGEGSTPSTAALDPVDEPVEADKSLPPDDSSPAGDGAGDADISATGDGAVEAEKSQEPASSTMNPSGVDVDPNDSDAPAASTKEEPNNSPILNSGGNPEPYEGRECETLADEGTHAVTVVEDTVKASENLDTADDPDKPSEPAVEVEVASQPAEESDAIPPATAGDDIVQSETDIAQPSSDEPFDTSPRGTPADFSQQQSDDEKPMDTAEESAHTEDPQATNDATITPDENDDGTRKLISDNSNVSVQSAGYDEENFEDDEGQQETDAAEPAVAATEDATEDVKHQEHQSSDIPDNAAAPDITETNIDAPAALDAEDTFKTLAANNSEVSVHSEPYEDDDFDEGAQEVEKPSVDPVPDESSHTPDQQIVEVKSSGGNVEDDLSLAETLEAADAIDNKTVQDLTPADTPTALVEESGNETKDAAIDEGSPKYHASQGDDLSTGEQEDVPNNEVPTDDSDPAAEVDQSSGQHQLHPIDLAVTEIPIQADPSADSSDTANKVDPVKDSSQSTDHEAAADALMEDPIDASEPRPITPDNPATSIEADDATGPSDSAAPSADVDSPEFAEYDGDDFDDAPEDKETPVDTVMPDLGDGNENATNVLDTEPISKENTDDVSDISTPTIEQEDDDPLHPAPTSESEPQPTSQPENTNDEVTPTQSVEDAGPDAVHEADDGWMPMVPAPEPQELSSTPSAHLDEESSPAVPVDERGLDPVVDPTGEAVKDMATPETDSAAAVASEGSSDQASSAYPEDESDKADDPVPETTAINYEMPPFSQNEEPSRQVGSSTPEDEPSINSVVEPLVEQPPEQASATEDANAEGSETPPTDEPDHTTAASGDAHTTDQMNDYSQGADDFDEDVSEPEQKSTDADVVAETPMEPAVNATRDEHQYADADFDEDATTSLNEIPADEASVVQPDNNDDSAAKDTPATEDPVDENVTSPPTIENNYSEQNDEIRANEVDNEALVIENPEPKSVAATLEPSPSANAYEEDFPVDDRPSVAHSQLDAAEVVEPVIANPEPITAPEFVAVTSEPSPSTNAYEEDFPDDDAPPVTQRQLGVAEDAVPTNDTLENVEQVVAAEAEDAPPESNPSVAASEEENFSPEDATPETVEQVTMNVPAVCAEGASPDDVSAADEGSGALGNSDSDPQVPAANNEDPTPVSNAEDTMPQTSSKEELYDEGFEEDKPALDAVESGLDDDNDHTLTTAVNPPATPDIAIPDRNDEASAESTDANNVDESEKSVAQEPDAAKAEDDDRLNPTLKPVEPETMESDPAEPIPDPEVSEASPSSESSTAIKGNPAAETVSVTSSDSPVSGDGKDAPVAATMAENDQPAAKTNDQFGEEGNTNEAKIEDDVDSTILPAAGTATDPSLDEMNVESVERPLVDGNAGNGTAVVTKDKENDFEAKGAQEAGSSELLRDDLDLPDEEEVTHGDSLGEPDGVENTAAVVKDDPMEAYKQSPEPSSDITQHAEHDSVATEESQPLMEKENAGAPIDAKREEEIVKDESVLVSKESEEDSGATHPSKSVSVATEESQPPEERTEIAASEEEVVKDEPAEVSKELLNPSSDISTAEPVELVPTTSEESKPLVNEQDTVAPVDEEYEEDEEVQDELAVVSKELTKSSPDTGEQPNALVPTTSEEPQSVVKEQNTAVSGEADYDDEQFADEPPSVPDKIVARDKVAVEDNAPKQSAHEEPSEMEYESPRFEEEEEIPKSNDAHKKPESPSALPAEVLKSEENGYDDDDGYNEFDDQDNSESLTPAVVSRKAPVPAVEPPVSPTEDEYEDFENDEDPQEEKLTGTKSKDTPPVVSVPPSSTPSDPPASARDEDIEEVAEEAQDAEEEAYAEEQDYNEFEEDDTSPSTSSKATPAAAPEDKQNKPTHPPVEAAEGEGDDYEDEEEYGDDEGEFEKDSPRTKPITAPVQSAATAKSDVDEMDDEVGYDSEYNESDD